MVIYTECKISDRHIIHPQFRSNFCDELVLTWNIHAYSITNMNDVQYDWQDKFHCKIYYTPHHSNPTNSGLFNPFAFFCALLFWSASHHMYMGRMRFTFVWNLSRLSVVGEPQASLSIEWYSLNSPGRCFCLLLRF